MTAITALSDSDICNMALSHIGQSATIASLNPPDQTQAGQVCAFWYPKMRNWLLQIAPWNFAFTSTKLVSDATVFPGYAYSYQTPNDCMQPVAVVTSAGQRNATAYWNNYWFPYPPFNASIPKIFYKVVQSQAVSGQTCIVCDIQSTAQNPLFLLYIQCVTNTALFDAMFLDCLSLYVGSRIGVTMRADAQKVAGVKAAADAMRLQALAQHMNAAQQDMERASPSIMTR